MSGILYIISAPSGSGKTTLATELRKRVPRLKFSISYTTRRPRGSEEHGRDYFFVSSAEFERMVAAGEFLEHAEVFGDRYGTARHFLQRATAEGNDLLLDIDVQGARQIKSRVPDAVAVFILPPSKQDLQHRLRKRSQAEGGYSEEVIQRRLLRAAKEIENYRNYDYILVNDRLEQSIEELEAIVLAERLRRSGRPLTPDELKVVEVADGCRQQQRSERAQRILESFALSVTPGRP